MLDKEGTNALKNTEGWSSRLNQTLESETGDISHHEQEVETLFFFFFFPTKKPHPSRSVTDWLTIIEPEHEQVVAVNN